MRNAVAALLLLFLSLPALSAEAEGTVTKVDPEAMTITLDDGGTYKLPAEMDISVITDGVQVVLAYQETENGVKQITDMFLPE
ncbi:DUF1344 domain-containing protein [Chelativorans sp. SCAU2101]|jgi:Protein of unknown function (DUF1344).|uniref:DUF1344 domain-containing protein n=1 Tax=Chelativorans petroleitrophicus TaxID=2975484 RepID=A0A9X3BA62_9HYPH|nr:DUF1344 domain-containing protein [Chelativorans petroleitrophicus]MCT8991416.1 DUF1344 domain-containing protein [Chelativorans petroleitrophicus]